MRITQNSAVGKYETNLMEVRRRFTKTQNEIGTGTTLNTLSDNPAAVGEVDRLTNTILQNTAFKKNMEDALTDTSNVEEALDNFKSVMMSSMDIMRTGVNPTNFDKLPVLGQNLRQLIDDMVQIANYDYDGRFLFSGTKTTRASIQAQAPATNDLPYELVKDPAIASPQNPEGLRVVFKGNNEERRVRTSVNSTERVNVVPEDAFGSGGTEVFDTIIRAYNIIRYQQDGTPRGDRDFMEPDRARELQGLLDKMGDSFDHINGATARLGGVINRMQTLSDQLENENTTLRDLRSAKEDTELPSALISLRKDELALQTSLQIGVDVIQRSLFDFLR